MPEWIISHVEWIGALSTPLRVLVLIATILVLLCVFAGLFGAAIAGVRSSNLSESRSVVISQILFVVGGIASLSSITVLLLVVDRAGRIVDERQEAERHAAMEAVLADYDESIVRYETGSEETLRIYFEEDERNELIYAVLTDGISGHYEQIEFVVVDDVEEYGPEHATEVEAFTYNLDEIDHDELTEDTVLHQAQTREIRSSSADAPTSRCRTP